MDDILRLMSETKVIQRINDSLYLRREDFDLMIRKVREHYSENDTMTVGDFRDMLGTTRKYALPFLEYLDSNRITMRVGDERKAHPSFLKKE
jgi:selenocysteine-specific elongation factor